MGETTYTNRNIHSGHRFHEVYVHELEDTLTADIDVVKGRRHEVRWRFRGLVASCVSAEAAEAAFRLALVGTRFGPTVQRSTSREGGT